MTSNYQKEVFAAGTLNIDNYRRVLAAIHRAVDEQGYKDILLDFSRCTIAYAGGVLPIISYVRALQRSHIDFSLLLPQNDTLKRRFQQCGWAYLIEPRRHEPPSNYRTMTPPALVFESTEQQQESVNRVIDTVLSSVSGMTRADFAAVEWALNEITDNVLNHAQCPSGGTLQLTLHHLRRRAIEFTVCDAGLGVAHTLRDARRDIVSDIDALAEAVKEGVTRNSVTNQGNGLFGSFEVCRISKGEFRLHSNTGCLELEKEVVAYRRETIPFSGTLVDATIDLSDPGVLDQALKFRGQVHRPTDRVEMKYESEDLLTFRVKLIEECSSFASRSAGKPIRIKLRNLVEMSAGQKIYIDFTGIGVVSSSFADEVFGMLFAELGPMKFMSHFVLANASPMVTNLLDRAMTLRGQQGTASV